MTESNSKPEKPKYQRQFSQEQYDMLKRCSDKKDMTEWNKWRKENPAQDIELDIAQLDRRWLQYVHFGAETLPTNQWLKEPGKKSSFSNLCSVQLYCSHCEGANFELAHLEMASAHRAHLEGAFLHYAHLNNACFAETHLEGASLDGSHLQGANFERAIVNGATSIWRCEVDRDTNFEGVPLDNIRIDPSTKQLLEYNIRRKNWERWYRYKDWSNWRGSCKQRSKISRALCYIIILFWQISDYGISTKGIMKTFFKWAFIFAIIYYVWGCIDYHLMCNKDYPGVVSNLFVLEDSKQAVSGWLVPLRAVYFSIVTMTTLGFGDMYANAHSLIRGIFGHILLALQVILGYVLLGALVTRFAVLFTAGGPAGKFADDKEKEDKEKKNR